MHILVVLDTTVGRTLMSIKGLKTLHIDIILVIKAL